MEKQQQQKQKTAKSRNRNSQRYKIAGKQAANKIRRVARQVLAASKKARRRNCKLDLAAESALLRMVGPKEFAKFVEHGMAAFK